MSLPDLLILGLATFYASYVLTSTDGPLSIFLRIRLHIKLGGLTTCIYCAAFWFAVGFYLLLRSDLAVVVYPFAGVGAAMLLYRQTGGPHV